MDFEPSVKSFFENLGYTVQKIDEGENESPDFLVPGGDDAYLVEPKTKFVSEKRQKE